MKRPLHWLVLLFCVLILYPARAHAGRALPFGHTRYPVLVGLADGSSATGFYVHSPQGKAFFVTAKHILFEEALEGDRLKTEKALLASYPREETLENQILIELHLPALEKSGDLKVHARYDVVIVKIGEIDKSSEIFQLKFSPGVSQMAEAGTPSRGSLLGANLSNIKTYDDVSVGNDVFIFGYPTSLGITDYPQLDFKKPLLRKGVIAGKNDEKKTIILDCPTHYGMSGGPVIEIEQMSITERKFSVIGLVSEFIPFDEKRYGIQNILPGKGVENSGYSVVIPMDAVLELIEENFGL